MESCNVFKGLCYDENQKSFKKKKDKCDMLHKKLRTIKREGFITFNLKV